MPQWATAEVVEAKSKNGATLTTQPDGSVLVSGKNSPTDVYTVKLKTNLSGITALRLEVLPDPSLPAMGPGRAPNGNFVLTHIKVEAKETGATGNGQAVVLVNPVATFAQDQFPLANDAGQQPGDRVGHLPAGRQGQRRPLRVQDAGQVRQGGRVHDHADAEIRQDHTIGKFRFSLSTTKTPLHFVSPPAAIMQVLAVEPAKRTPQQQAQLTQLLPLRGRRAAPFAAVRRRLRQTGRPAAAGRAGSGVGAD